MVYNKWQLVAPIKENQFIATNIEWIPFVNKKDADRDKSWMPYTYHTIYCIKCKCDTLVRYKKWFGYFTGLSESDLQWRCEECADNEMNESVMHPVGIPQQ